MTAERWTLRRLVWRSLILGVLLLAAVFLGDVLLLLLVGALLSYLVEPLVNLAEGYLPSRTLAVALIFVVLGLGLFVVGLYVAPILAEQVAALQVAVRNGGFVRYLGELQAALDPYVPYAEQQQFVQRIESYAGRFFSAALAWLPNVFSFLGQLILLPFIVFFLLKDGHAIKKQFIGLIPNRYFEFTLNVLYKVDLQLGAYLRGQILASSCVGALAIVALWLIGIDSFIVIGLVAGFTNLIPYLGPVLGGLIAIVVSVTTMGTFEQVPWIVFSFVLIQLFDNVIVQPLVIARNVELHPLVVLLAIIAGGKLIGPLGLLVAVPIVAGAKVILAETYALRRRYRFNE